MPVSSCKCRVSCVTEPPRGQHRGLAADLVAERPLDPAQRVDVLGLGSRAERSVGGRAQGHVGVTAQRALLHPDVGDTQRAQQVAQHGRRRPAPPRAPGPGPLDRLGDDLDQRDAGAVVVEQRVVGPVDPAGRPADVQRLAGVLLHVRPLDADPVGLAVDLDLGPAVVRDRLVVLGDLVVLRHVGIEVVLPGEAAPFGDLAAQRQADADRGLDRLGVHHRQRARAGRGRPGRPGCSGSAPKAVEQPQNIFEAVLSSTCTSRPSTGSKAASASS